MRIVSYTDSGRHLNSLATLINEVYRDYPEYAESRARMIAKALAPTNPFLKYGDIQGFLAYSGSRLVAHACAIVDRRLPGIGLIGFFGSFSESAYGEAVLQEAIGCLTSQGVSTIRGPVDLTTWHGFRLSYQEEEPPFFLEPFTRTYYRSFFQDLGFSVAQHNTSTIHTADQVGFDRFGVNFETLQADGFVFDKVGENQLFAVLPLLHKLVINCFADTWSFVPISFEEFEYGFADPSQPYSETLVHVAHTPAGEPVGFCFGALDSLCKVRRAIVKTVAVVPMERRLEVARALLYCIYEAARERGASDFILSTMRDDNKGVRALTAGTRRTYRQYEVYELELGG